MDLGDACIGQGTIVSRPPVWFILTAENADVVSGPHASESVARAAHDEYVARHPSAAGEFFIRKYVDGEPIVPALTGKE